MNGQTAKIVEAFQQYIKERGVTFAEDIRETATGIVGAFVDQNITRYSFDCNPLKWHETGILDCDIRLTVDNGITFLITTESSDNGGTLNFSIIQNGEVLAMGHDKIPDFKNNINKFFQYIKGNKTD